MNSYRRSLRNGALVNPKLFILEKFNLGPHTKCWSNLVKHVKNSYYLVRVVTVELEKEKRKTPPLYDLRRSGGRNSSSQDLKFVYSTRAMHGYRQHAVSPKISGLEKKS